MDGDVMAIDVLQDAVVGRRSPARVVFGLQAVDRDANLQPPERRPLDRYRPHRAGYHLHKQAALGQLRQHDVELTVTDQRLAADERDVQRAQPIDHFEDTVDEGLALAVGHCAERLAAAKMVVAIGVATRTAQGAFARVFEGKIGAASGEDLTPGADDAFHSPDASTTSWRGLHVRPSAGHTRARHFEATNMISTRPSAPTRPVLTVARAGKSFAIDAR